MYFLCVNMSVKISMEIKFRAKKNLFLFSP